MIKSRLSKKNMLITQRKKKNLKGQALRTQKNIMKNTQSRKKMIKVGGMDTSENKYIRIQGANGLSQIYEQHLIGKSDSDIKKSVFFFDFDLTITPGSGFHTLPRGGQEGLTILKEIKNKGGKLYIVSAREPTNQSTYGIKRKLETMSMAQLFLKGNQSNSVSEGDKVMVFDDICCAIMKNRRLIEVTQEIINVDDSYQEIIPELENLKKQLSSFNKNKGLLKPIMRLIIELSNFTKGDGQSKKINYGFYFDKAEHIINSTISSSTNINQKINTKDIIKLLLPLYTKKYPYSESVFELDMHDYFGQLFWDKSRENMDVKKEKDEIFTTWKNDYNKKDVIPSSSRIPPILDRRLTDSVLDYVQLKREKISDQYKELGIRILKSTTETRDLMLAKDCFREYLKIRNKQEDKIINLYLLQIIISLLGSDNYSKEEKDADLEFSVGKWKSSEKIEISESLPLSKLINPIQTDLNDTQSKSKCLEYLKKKISEVPKHEDFVIPDKPPSVEDSGLRGEMEKIKNQINQIKYPLLNPAYAFLNDWGLSIPGFTDSNKTIPDLQKYYSGKSLKQLKTNIQSNTVRIEKLSRRTLEPDELNAHKQKILSEFLSHKKESCEQLIIEVEKEAAEILKYLPIEKTTENDIYKLMGYIFTLLNSII